MAFLRVEGVRIAGVSSAVPKSVEKNDTLSIFTPEEAEKFMAGTGVRSRHVSRRLLSSDLCCASAKRLMADLNWDASSIDGLVVVTQSPDYQRPGNAPLLQYRLGLSTECLAVSITLGCSGWVYALSVVAGLIRMGCQRVLLCCGEGNQAYYPKDKSTYPLFGSAGTCTALESCQTAAPIYFHLATDGEGWRAIHIPDGGYRHPATVESFAERDTGDGNYRTALNTALDGMDVFMFGISQPPKSIKALCSQFSIDLSSIDYLLLHQANLFLNGKIRAKLKMPENKVPHNIEEFGNTSSASLPLLMSTRMAETLRTDHLKLLACAFGVGLSWGTVAFETEHVVVSELVEVEDDQASV